MKAIRNQAHIFRRYLWLYDTIARRQPVTYEELRDLWHKTDWSYGSTLPHKTFENHRNAIEELFDVRIECDRRTNRYYIREDQPTVDASRSLLDNAIMLNNLASSSDMRKRVSLERIHGRTDFLRVIISALGENRLLTITYRHNYEAVREEKVDVKPIGIKLFRQRWYLIAELPDGSPYSYSLDRIVDIEGGGVIAPSKWDLQSLYNDAYGIIREKQTPPEDVILKVEREQANYFKNLPLHHSQRIISEDSESVTFGLRVAPTYDFIMELLSHGPKVEVLAPADLRRKIAERVKQLLKFYHDVL